MDDASSIGKREAVVDPWKVRPPCRPRQPTSKGGHALTVDTPVGPRRRFHLVEQVVGPADIAEMFQLHVRTSCSPEPALSRDATPALRWLRSSRPSSLREGYAEAWSSGSCGRG